jgi:hypothetical protein
MFFLLISLALTLLACFRGWFPFAFLVFAIPYVMPLLASYGFDSGGDLASIRELSAFGVPGGALSLGVLSLMGLVSRD